MKKRYALSVVLGIMLSSPLIGAPKVLLLDIGGLFLQFSKFAYAKKVGLGRLLGYAICDMQKPWDIKDVIFDVIKKVPVQLKPGVKPLCDKKGKEMPPLVCAYQSGSITNEDALCLVSQTCDELCEKSYFISARQADVVRRACTLVFTPEYAAGCVYELRGGVRLLQELACEKDEQGNKKYLIVALSNWDKHSAAIIKKQYPHIFECFDHVYFSGDIGASKPNFSAYAYPIEKLGLKKEDCVFVDDQIENIKAAQEFGIGHTILYKNAKQARAELCKLGILPRYRRPRIWLRRRCAS